MPPRPLAAPASPGCAAGAIDPACSPPQLAHHSAHSKAHATPAPRADAIVLAMAFIDTTPPAQAEGRLKSIYDQAVTRAGRVYKIVEIQGANPPVLAASMGLYRAVMLGDSPLTRIEREAIAVVVSRANDCYY
ncbi:MAG: hypothetical protein DRQ55_00830 [Planctomycetota bacterium]|nr:MAG: hypothetical protein DRQ55_00830 [Planctomycetota bacterium]